MSKDYIVQIFTGGYKEEVTYARVEDKILPLLNERKVSKVIIGWSVLFDGYEELLGLLKKYEVESYLWLPVFSETGLLQEVERLVDYNEKEVRNYSLKEGETFEFYCPNNSVNVQAVISIYENYFKKYNFDGVFLDKIRYGSFANGLSGVINCFCTDCKRAYEDNGINWKYIKEIAEKETPFDITSYRNGKFEFHEEAWSEFFEFKSNSVYQAVEVLSDYFRKENKKIGMDTFAPFMSYFVGQDYEKLMGLTDFFKPMMYRITNAPAGLPFEYANFLEKSGIEKKPFLKDALDRIIGIKHQENSEFDIEFVKKELDYITSLGVPVYCGIEVNYIETIAQVEPEYIKANIQELSKTNIDGFVLSWDLLSAPEKNIETAKVFMPERGSNG